MGAGGCMGNFPPLSPTVPHSPPGLAWPEASQEAGAVQPPRRSGVPSQGYRWRLATGRNNSLHPGASLAVCTAGRCSHGAESAKGAEPKPCQEPV